MSLYDRDRFEALIATFQGAHIVRQWGDASVGKLGGKIFAILSVWIDDAGPHISFKCSDMAFELLPELDGVAPAKYLARAKWVDVAQDSALADDDIKAYIGEAHRLVAAKLTRATRAELGLD